MSKQTPLEQVVQNYGNTYIADTLDSMMSAWVSCVNNQMVQDQCINTRLEDHYQVLKDLRDVFRTLENVG